MKRKSNADSTEQKQSKIKGTVLSKWVIGVTVLITITGVVVLFKSLTEKIYQERSNSLGWTAAKIVQVIEATGQSQWTQLYYVANDFEEKAPQNKDELLQTMDSINRKLEQKDTVILAFDDKGNYYAADGKRGRWSNPEMLTNTSKTHQLTIEEFGDEQEEHMAFLYALPQAVTLQGGITVTHMALLYHMASFEEALQISSIQNSSFTYILNKDGTHVYHQKNQKELLAAYNIFTALESWEFLHGASAKDIQDAVHENKKLTLEVSKNGEPYFISYHPMGMNDWGMILFVPTDSINGNTTDILRSVFVQIAFVAISIILLVSFVIRLNSQKTIQKQHQAQKIMQNAAEEATRASRAKSRFLSHMSHDIRTPINGIIGMSYIARKNINDKDKVEDCLKKISVSSDHLLSLINDVLDMSSIEQDVVQICEKPIDPVKLLDECAVIIEGQLVGHHIRFIRDYESLMHRTLLIDALHMFLMFF